MATSITINRFNAKLRANPSQHERLRRILGEAIDGGLEASVERHGIGQVGELCIREVHALIRLAPSESDENLSAKLAFAIAEAIQSEIGKDDADIVHYGSQAHALADFAASALSGDFSRAWAWRQMGVSDREFAVSVADVVRQVLAALAAQPRQATAVLTHLAHDRNLFGRLLGHASGSQWQDLALSVVEALGGGAAVLAQPTSPALPAADDPAYRLVGQSRIAQAVLAAKSANPPLDALAALAISEVEPALLGGPLESARARLQAVALILSKLVGAKTPSAQTRPVADEVAPDPIIRPTRQDGPVQTGSASEPSIEGLETSPARQAQDEVLPGLASEAKSPDDFPSSGPAPHDAAKIQPQRPLPLAPGKHALPEVRRRGHTAFGGLLYLIHSVGHLVERILSEPRLAERSPRWCLHQLALALLPISANDPAALAFAGLLPGSEPPGEDQPPPDEQEREAIMVLRQEVLQDLRERLARYDIAEDVRLNFVCRRPAEIVADPGWLEIHFSLDDVSTEIRATGLDLDPGWIPCLGLVVRFVYV